MKPLVLLLCLAQLWGCHSAPHDLGLGYRQLNCDDPETEQLAQVAMDYINKHLVRGYKHVLNQIEKAKLWSQTSTGEIYKLEIETLETTCHAQEPTPVEKCPVRQLKDHAVEGECDVQLLKQNGQITVLYLKCSSNPDSAEDVRKVCADCPLLVSFNHSKVVHAVDAALAAFNAQSNGSDFQLVEVSRAQLLPSLPDSVYVEFVVAAIDCVAKEVTDPAKCNLLAKKQYAFCKSTLLVKADGEEVSVSCRVFQMQPVVPQPQPEGTVETPLSPAVEPTVPEFPPADVPAVALVLEPVVVVTAPQLPAVHQAHHDLRHTFVGVASGESASGEVKLVMEVKPGAPLPGSPVVRQCPGRIRHFKV
ncbi:alpha-2-HS-glycoprotein [Tamandua tetradactyla]|uniref:alpha-2-HS-glycoprotein n=1 Tax=Tamandua tetradactyla TaxID=48850 RepID=UPI0040544BE0